jgi:hypothetical protein
MANRVRSTTRSARSTTVSALAPATCAVNSTGSAWPAASRLPWQARAFSVPARHYYAEDRLRITLAASRDRPGRRLP